MISQNSKTLDVWCFVAVHDKAEYSTFFHNDSNEDAKAKNSPGEGSCNCWQSRGHRKSSPLSRNVTDAQLNDLLFGITTSQFAWPGGEPEGSFDWARSEAWGPQHKGYLGIQVWMLLCFGFSSWTSSFQNSVFSIIFTAWQRYEWYELQAAEAEKAAEVQKALAEAQTAAEAQLAAVGGAHGIWVWTDFERCLNSALPRPWGSSFQSNTGSTCDCLGLISRVSDPKSWLWSDLSKLVLIKSPSFSVAVGCPRCLKSQSCVVYIYIWSPPPPKIYLSHFLTVFSV